MSQVSTVTNETFATDVLNSKTAVLVDFYADWCGPCKSVMPILDELSSSQDFENVKFVKVNIDATPELAQKYGVRGIPTMMLIEAGSVVATKVGAQTKEQLKVFIQSNVKKEF